jgi:hypothetical protein
VFAGGLSFTRQIENIGPNTPETTNPLGGGGFTTAMIGDAVSFLGIVVLIVGTVLHIVAASRRKRVDRELTVQPPWRTPGS